MTLMAMGLRMDDTAWEKARSRMLAWRKDWCLFAREVLRVRLDREQEAILRSVQENRMTAVASGTARGKDFVAACAALCFLYLTPRWSGDRMTANTKIAMTAPTARQVYNIMMPEISRLFKRAGVLPGRLRVDGVRTSESEWFLTGFKADENNSEAWSGFHAVNTMFIVTEASGVPDRVYDAIEGNLQGNSRLLLVFNPNVSFGYAAKAMRSDRFFKFRLSSLDAENVRERRVVIPGQVDYDWVRDKVDIWCRAVSEDEFDEGKGDFVWEGKRLRPNDLFRVKVLGMFPTVGEDTLIPYEWVELANKRWEELRRGGPARGVTRRIGVDVAGMGRDSSVICSRYDGFVSELSVYQSGGRADHMHIAGLVSSRLGGSKGTARAVAFIDTIGEGAGVYSRLLELGHKNVVSCKFSEGAGKLRDKTGERSFANMRAYLFWAVREWLDPRSGSMAALPANDRLMEEITDIHWKFRSDGSVIIEPKEDIKGRIGRSPDLFDALANTFYPYAGPVVSDRELLDRML